MSRVRWTRRAVRDLRDIARYIARDSDAAARAWTARLRDRASKAARMPHAGRVVPEFGQEDLREVRLGTYRIIYQVHTAEIWIVTVIEGHRPLTDVDER